jgi:hypothetical protein
MLDEGIELVSFDYQAPSWSHPRRVIGIRHMFERIGEGFILSCEIQIS